MRLADLLYLPSGIENRQSYWNKIQSKHVDFVVTDIKNIKPLLIVELDDSTHNQKKRIERDKFLDKALYDAGVQVIHISTQHSYNVNELLLQIETIINKEEQGETQEHIDDQK